ncbi:dTDP-glucose 4,6-dehydratase [Klebsiella pneumoniae]|uniref:dTDP-glucose 4,6-dehydratase n=1 Tax=Klebsiella pneumoniae TaxID=573 RepID=A0A378FX45_KLEPN|nr:dTDP-glucose 4,6-dehydratase [Klebsiella pneumoniae]
MKFLVTGAAGFIGFPYRAAPCLNEGHDVVGIDNMNDYYDVSLKQARLDRPGISGIPFPAAGFGRP